MKVSKIKSGTNCEAVQNNCTVPNSKIDKTSKGCESDRINKLSLFIDSGSNQKKKKTTLNELNQMR